MTKINERNMPTRRYVKLMKEREGRPIAESWTTRVCMFATASLEKQGLAHQQASRKYYGQYLFILLLTPLPVVVPGGVVCMMIVGSFSDFKCILSSLRPPTHSCFLIPALRVGGSTTGE